MANGSILSPQDIEGLMAGQRKAGRSAYKRYQDRYSRGSFMERLGLHLAGSVAQQAIIDPISETVGGFLSKPYSDRDNIFLKNQNISTADEMGKMNAQRGASFMKRYRDGKDRGLSDQEIHAEEYYDTIRRDLAEQYSLGKIKDPVTGIPIPLEAVSGGPNDRDTILIHTARNLAEKKAESSHDQYMAIIKELGDIDLGDKADENWNKHIGSFNTLSNNWLESASNFILGRSNEDLNASAYESLQKDKTYIEHTEVRKAFEAYDEFSSEANLEEAILAKKAVDVYKQYPESRFIVVSHTPTNRTEIDQDENSPTYLQTVTRRGVETIVRDRRKPDAMPVVTFNATKSPVLATSIENLSNLIGSPSAAIKNLNITDTAKQNLKARIKEEYPNYTLGNPIRYAQIHKKKGLEDQEAILAIIDEWGLDDANRVEPLSVTLREARIQVIPKIQAARRAILGAEEYPDDGSRQEALEAASTYLERDAKLQAGIESKMITLNSVGEAVPLYHYKEPLGINSKNPFAKKLNTVTGLLESVTNKDYAVAMEKWDRWQKGLDFTPQARDALLKDRPELDEEVSFTQEEISRAKEVFPHTLYEGKIREAGPEVTSTGIDSEDGSGRKAIEKLSTDSLKLIIGNHPAYKENQRFENITIDNITHIDAAILKKQLAFVNRKLGAEKLGEKILTGIADFWTKGRERALEKAELKTRISKLSPADQTKIKQLTATTSLLGRQMSRTGTRTFEADPLSLEAAYRIVTGS